MKFSRCYEQGNPEMGLLSILQHIMQIFLVTTIIEVTAMMIEILGEGNPLFAQCTSKSTRNKSCNGEVKHSEI